MEIPLCCVLKQECIPSSQLESAGSLKSADPLLLHCHRVEFLHLINSGPFSNQFASKITQSAYFCLRISSCSVSSTPGSSGQLKAGCLGDYGVSHCQGIWGDMPLSIVLAQGFLSSCSRFDALQLESCGRLGPFVTHILFF